MYPEDEVRGNLVSAKESPINNSIAYFEKAVAQNTELVANLENRLNSVLSPTSQAEGKEPSSPKNSKATLSNAIFSLVDILERNNARMRCILNDLEL
jgi:hypothetical protein